MMTFKRAAAALIVLTAATLAAAAPASAAEKITRFVSDVDVQRSGDLLVTETIDLVAEGDRIKRGIVRDFPTSYKNPDGSHVEIGFGVLWVKRDGAQENYAIEQMTNGTRVRIGRADTLLSTGPHQYVIAYRTTRQLGFFKDFDELYWNATGTGWTFPIEVAEARITLPEAVPFRQSAFYTGAQGAKGKDAAVVEQRPGHIVFRTTQTLPAANGLTVAASWPIGLIGRPTDADNAGQWLRDNLPLGVAALGLLLIVGYYVFAWRKVGHDPRKGTIIPLFAPPDGMSPAAVRYVSRMGCDERTFSAALIDLRRSSARSRTSSTCPTRPLSASTTTRSGSTARSRSTTSTSDSTATCPRRTTTRSPDSSSASSDARPSPATRCHTTGSASWSTRSRGSGSSG